VIIFEVLKRENPIKSFIAITQATKGGNFKGDQSLEHNCDFVVKIVCLAIYDILYVCLYMFLQ